VKLANAEFSIDPTRTEGTRGTVTWLWFAAEGETLEWISLKAERILED
jgi:hypothetical protein